MKSVIINQLKHICTHQRFISVINRLKKAHLKTHSEVQHGRIKFECNNCDRDFQSKKTLNNHNERIHKQVIDNKKDDTTVTVTSDNNVENIDNNRTNNEVQNMTISRMSIED